MEKELHILAESLDQKARVLQGILQISKNQEDVLKKTEPDLDSFDQMVDKKDQLIDVLTHLDEGFEALYERISVSIKSKKNEYVTTIAELQKKIEIVTSYSVQIQEQEARNKQIMDEFFNKQKLGIKSGRQNSKVAFDYYKSMSNMGTMNSRFMDSKQYRD